MKYYCPKCGHASDVSAADIRRQGGTVVCPQCLTTFQMPVAGDDSDDTPPPIPARRSRTAAPKSAPRPRTAPASRPSRPQRQTATAAPRRTATTSRRAPVRKPVKPKTEAQTSTAKFALISIGVTAAFFALYALVGILFDKL